MIRLAALLAAALAAAGPVGCGRAPEPVETCAVQTGPIRVWTTYTGKLEARRVEIILSKFQGSATIVELAPEGARVQPGDLLVRFDSSQVERDLLKLQRDYEVARTELERLEKAEQPLELRELEAQRLEALAQYETERRFLEDSRSLLAEGLVSEQEIEQQSLKVDQLRAALDKLDQRIALTKEYLHPAALAKARATLAAAEQELALARQQLESCRVVAPAEGIIVYRPLHIGGEYRTVRVGDSLYRNQPFMSIPDMRDLVVELLVPEAELSRVQVGAEAVVSPIAYPDLRLRGQVETVGSMAVSAIERPGFQRFFRAVIGLRDTDPRLRSGMSVRADILSYSRDDALLVPRTFVAFDQGEPFVQPIDPRAPRRRIVLGWGDLRHFEVLEGLSAGDRLRRP
ncbi:MAG: efflux RND transporter periplasmic adaptor subunit [Kiritimatiellae bacterium]|nr:efflux RND transporter periplasmic adaptor subunit [Kiritimatiellia bacterium]MDW8459037.1 efflux RND transporter periplasmic adaptor subunit [Verrucomicrobiota bacterium]